MKWFRHHSGPWFSGVEGVKIRRCGAGRHLRSRPAVTRPARTPEQPPTAVRSRQTSPTSFHWPACMRCRCPLRSPNCKLYQLPPPPALQRAHQRSYRPHCLLPHCYNPAGQPDQPTHSTFPPWRLSGQQIGRLHCTKYTDRGAGRAAV